MKPSDARKSNKPIMEKRRRARINNCLNELKALILDALKKDPSRHSKLEKADILDMTVKYLQSLQRQQMAMAVAADPTVISKFRAGFGECANEVSRFVTRADGVDPVVRQRLLGHLSHYLKNLHTLGDSAGSAAVSAPTPLSLAGFQLPAMMQAAAAVSSQSQINGDLGQTSATSTLFRGLQLIPTRLPNGEILFLLPSPFATAAAAAAASASPTTPTPTSQPLSVDVASSPPSSASTAPLSSIDIQDSPTSAVAQDLTRKLSMSPYSDSCASPASNHEDQGNTMTSPNGKDPWRPW